MSDLNQLYPSPVTLPASAPANASDLAFGGMPALVGGYRFVTSENIEALLRSYAPTPMAPKIENLRLGSFATVNALIMIEGQTVTLVNPAGEPYEDRGTPGEVTALKFHYKIADRLATNETLRVAPLFSESGIPADWDIWLISEGDSAEVLLTQQAIHDIEVHIRVKGSERDEGLGDAFLTLTGLRIEHVEVPLDLSESNIQTSSFIRKFLSIDALFDTPFIFKANVHSVDDS